MHVVLAIDSLGSGGAQRQVVELAAQLRRQPGVRCSVLVYQADDFYAPRLRESGVALARIPKRLRVDPLLPWRIGRWLGQAGADVVHAFLLAPCLWTLLAVRTLPRRRRPALIAAERNCLIATSPLLGALQRLVYRRADAVTANAACAAGEIAAKLGVPEGRVHYLPNGIDLERWDADARCAPPFELDPGCFHLALVGGLRPQKAHHVLLDALVRLGPERIAGWRVWCVGGRTAGERAAASVEARIREAGLGAVVRLVPPLRNVAALMARLDALVLPSLFEGFPNVVLEAMACRLPVVATPVGDVPNLVADGESGLLVPAGDAGALARALDSLAALPPDERRRMGERGRAAAEARFSIEQVALRHLALYRAVGGRESGA